MRFAVRLAGEFTVWDEGGERSPAPDRTVATLLIGLLAVGDDWTPRAEVVRRLYPASDADRGGNALRQALFRLRAWLGPEVVEARSGCLRLVPDRFAVEWPAENLAPGLDHPWVETIRNEHRTAAPSSPPTHFRDFARAVESAAAVDRDAARGILLGGAALVANMPPEAALRLVGLTRPVHRGEPQAFEHLELKGRLHLQAFALDSAGGTYARAFRLATHQKSAAKAARAAAMLMFVAIESGDMAEAATWLDRCAALSRTAAAKPLLDNARACYLWNANRMDEALLLVKRTAPATDAADRAQWLHYWVNVAALAADSGAVETQFEAEREARRLAVPSLDVAHLRTLEYAGAIRMMRQGLLDESLRSLRSLRARSVAESDIGGRVYVEEAIAEALTQAGGPGQGAWAWKGAEAVRRSAHGGPTPRLAARKASMPR